MTLSTLIQYLLVILRVVGIVAVLRLWSVLGSVRVTLANLEATRQEASETLQRLDATMTATQQVLRDEVAPTLQAARATLTNVELATRALAGATSSLRRMTGRAEMVSGTAQLISGGRAAPGGLFGMALGVGAKLAGLLTRRGAKAAPSGLPASDASKSIASERKTKHLPSGARSEALPEAANASPTRMLQGRTGRRAR